MLRDLGGAQTLLFSSHILAEVEALCDRILVLSDGLLVADESVTEAVVVEWVAPDSAPGDAVERALEAFARTRGEGASSPTRVASARIDVPIRGGETVAETSLALGRAFAAAGLVVTRLEPGRRRLEERFARVTGAIGEEDPLRTGGETPPENRP
jgi:ABC-2 type transport system ATP-binding protein